MARTKKYWLTSFNKLLSFVLIALGFNACDDKYMKAMYGMPPARYSVKANVLNEANQPISGIRVDVKDNEYGNYIVESGLTNSKGIYETSTYPEKINVVCTDIDGDSNGSYKKDSVQIDFSKEETLDYEFTIKLKKEE